MKLNFILCMSGLCISNCVALYIPRCPIFVDGLTKAVGQSDSTTLSNYDVCLEALQDECCTTGYYQENVDTIQQCYNTDESFAGLLKVMCTPNSMGGYCEVQPKLDTEVCKGGSNSSCSSECRNYLISIRGDLSCCIARVYNDSTSFGYIPDLFGHALWSSCDIEPVTTQDCPPSKVTIPPYQPDPSCRTSSDYLQRIFSTTCKLQYMDAIVNRLLSTRECQADPEDTDDFYALCTVDRFGRYCGEFREENILSGFFSAANDSCHNTSTCDSLCIETLKNTTNAVGCCFNEDYNTTSTHDWLSSDFWFLCNVESPGLCQQRYTDEGKGKISTPKT